MSFLLEAAASLWLVSIDDQANPVMNTFLLNFEQLLADLNSIKPHMLSVTGDFNVRSSSWWFDNMDAI